MDFNGNHRLLTSGFWKFGYPNLIHHEHPHFPLMSLFGTTMACHGLSRFASQGRPSSRASQQPTTSPCSCWDMRRSCSETWGRRFFGWDIVGIYWVFHQWWCGWLVGCFKDVWKSWDTTDITESTYWLDRNSYFFLSLSIHSPAKN